MSYMKLAWMFVDLEHGIMHSKICALSVTQLASLALDMKQINA